MKIYWYWPHPHRAASPLCLAVLRPGDDLTVHALPSLAGESFDRIEEYEVVRDLPDPSLRPNGRMARAIRPARIAVGRSGARARLLRRGFDVAHIGNLFFQTDWADLYRLRRRVPLVCDVHDIRPHRRQLPAPIETLLLRRTYHNASQLIVLHAVLKDEIVADFGVDPDRVHVVPHVLDAAACRVPVRRDEERPMLLFFGTLRADKGLDVLTEALLALGPKLEAEVVIAGSGTSETYAALERRLAGLSHVRLELGRVSAGRKAELFSAASWILLPYIAFHSQSGVLADAYAYRVPLIASDVGAIGPTVRDDATGIVIAPRDVGALADAMIRAAATPPAAFAEALDDAARRHDVGVVGRRLREIYDIAVNDS